MGQAIGQIRPPWCIGWSAGEQLLPDHPRALDIAALRQRQPGEEGWGGVAWVDIGGLVERHGRGGGHDATIMRDQRIAIGHPQIDVARFATGGGIENHCRRAEAVGAHHAVGHGQHRRRIAAIAGHALTRGFHLLTETGRFGIIERADRDTGCTRLPDQQIAGQAEHDGDTQRQPGGRREPRGEDGGCPDDQAEPEYGDDGGHAALSSSFAPRIRLKASQPPPSNASNGAR